MFEIYFRPRAFKLLRKLNRNNQLKINSALDILKSGKFNLLDLNKIRGTEKGYRLRIGRFRVLLILFLKEKRIEIVDIFLKKDSGDYFKRKKLIP